MSSEEGTSVDAPMPAMDKGTLTSQLLSDEGLRQAFGTHLQSLVGQTSTYIESMPENMKKRIRALKNLQAEHTRLEAKFYEDVQALERKYAELHAPSHEKRRRIVAGEYEPTEEEMTLEFDEEDEDEGDGQPESEEEEEGAKITECDENGEPLEDEEAKAEKAEKVVYDETTTGIPEFWATVLANVPVVAPLIEDRDRLLLNHLMDITIQHYAEPLGFDLVFHFSKNDFLSNETLVKHYDMKIEVDEDAPFTFDGPQIIGCKGCEINWKKGKNLTLKVVKKKQKSKGKGQPGKTITKQVKAETFFDFFNPPDVPDTDPAAEDEDEEYAEAVDRLSQDYEIASTIRDHVVGKAVLLFTGENVEDDDEMGMPMMDFGDDDEDEE